MRMTFRHHINDMVICEFVSVYWVIIYIRGRGFSRGFHKIVLTDPHRAWINFECADLWDNGLHIATWPTYVDDAWTIYVFHAIYRAPTVGFIAYGACEVLLWRIYIYGLRYMCVQCVVYVIVWYRYVCAWCCVVYECNACDLYNKYKGIGHMKG